MRRWVLLLLLLLGLVACHPNRTDYVPPAGTVCERMCSVLAAYGCPDAEPTPRGRTCIQVCEAAVAVSMTPDCVAAAGSRAGVEACGACR